MHGFRKQLHDKLGGVGGCTHVTELLTLPADGGGADVRRPAIATRIRRQDQPVPARSLPRARATTTETVRRYYPKWYRGAA